MGILLKKAALKSTFIYLTITLILSVITSKYFDYIFGISIFWLICINLVLFFLVAKDKLSAIINIGRTPEGTLLWLALLGAFPALFAGRFIFKHKTSKIEFIKPMWVLLALQIIAIAYYFIAL